MLALLPFPKVSRRFEARSRSQIFESRIWLSERHVGIASNTNFPPSGETTGFVSDMSGWEAIF
jgi:hypothetical protein